MLLFAHREIYFCLHAEEFASVCAQRNFLLFVHREIYFCLHAGEPILLCEFCYFYNTQKDSVVSLQRADPMRKKCKSVWICSCRGYSDFITSPESIVQLLQVKVVANSHLGLSEGKKESWKNSRSYFYCKKNNTAFFTNKIAKIIFLSFQGQ